MELYALQESYARQYLEKIENATFDERAAAIAAFGGGEPDGIITRDDITGEAIITVKGMLTPMGPSPLARFFGFGGTGYNEIIAAARELEADESIKTVRLAMNTPGGTVDGMGAARLAIQSLASKKTVIAENHGVLASSGYYVATAAHRITAMTPLALSGSIGVMMAGVDVTDALSREGVKRISIVSANAPNKDPDIATAQGQSIVQKELDAMERIFIDAVASGRNITAEDVIANFGKGEALVARDPDPEKPDALKAGMIDSVITQSGEVVAEIDDSVELTAKFDNHGGNVIPIVLKSTAEGGGKLTTRNVKMDMTQLKLEHSALYAQAVDEGVKTGIAQERSRADAHATMGEASGDMVYALACIKDGTDFTPAVNAKYLAANMNKAAIVARAGEGPGKIETKSGDLDVDENDKAVAAKLADNMGVAQ